MRKKKLIERIGEIEKPSVILADFSRPLSVIYRSFRQNIIKDVDNLKNTINQLALIVSSATLHPITAEYTFFSSLHGSHQDRPYSGS